MTKLKENVIAFFWAIVLTLWVVFFINSWTNNLATNVLWAKKNVQTSVDTILNYKSWSIELVTLKNLENVASVSLELLFDSSKVNLLQDDIDSSYNISSTKKEWWNGYDIIVSNIWSIKKNEKLFNVKNITKKQYDNINVGHIQLIDNNGRVLNLSNEKK